GARQFLGRGWAGPVALIGCGGLICGLGAGSAAAYFSRSEGRRYDAYTYRLVELGSFAAHPGSVVILDPYRALVVEFIDRDQPPRIVPPGRRLDPPRGDAVYA